MIYRRAWSNMVSDISKSLGKKFYRDAKLVSRETSKFQDDYNTGSELAGVRLQFDLPKYARIHVISVAVNSEQDYPSPSPTLYFYENDADGELLLEKSDNIEEGKNTIFIDQDFEVDQLFIGYDPASFSLKKTENKYYPSNWIHWDKLSCMWPCFAGQAGVTQINGGGLDVKYVIVCSVEKYVCENINFFQTALWYRIGLELMIERRLGNNLNEFTTMIQERADELQNFYNAQYQQELSNSIDPVNIDEDPFCFNCKNTVTSRTNLP